MKSMRDMFPSSKMGLVKTQMECSKHGMTQHTQLTGVDFLKPSCDKCSAEAKQQQDQEKAEAKKLQAIEARNNRLSKNGIDPTAKDFSDWDFDSSQTERQQKMLNALQRYANNFNTDLPNILLIGGTGSGKTMLANAVARTVFDNQYQPELTSKGFIQRSYSQTNPAHLIRSAEIIRQIKSTWSPASYVREDDLVNAWASHQLLIIDDLGDADAVGKEQTAADDRNRISQLINLRYQKAPTIITTNMNQAEVADFLGDRAWDRLQEKLVIIKCDWASYRQQTAKVTYL